MPFINNDYVMFALVAITIFSVYMSVVTLTRKDPMRERIKRVMPPEAPGVGYTYEDSKSPFFIFCSNLLTALGVDISKSKRDMYLPLARAGMMSTESLVYYLFFQRFIQPVILLIALVFFMRLFTMGDVRTSVKLLNLVLGGMFGIIGLYGGRMYLSNRTEKRKKELERSFPDALDLMLVCVESGLPLDSAISRVCRELKRAHPEITTEFDRTRIELNVLNDRAQALQNLAERTDTGGFRTLVSTLIQTEKVGSSIADMLRTLADEYRTSRMLYAENKAARIPALITVPLIFFIMPAFMLIIMGPPIIKIQQQGGLFSTVQQDNSR